MTRQSFVTLNRRGLLAGAAVIGVALAIPLAGPGGAFAQDGEPALAYSTNTLTSPSQSQQVAGAQAFADSLGKQLNVLLTGGNSEKGIADIRALLVKHQGNVVLMVDPLDSPDARAIVEEVDKAGGKVVTLWNKPDDLHPWDIGDNYVAHISFSGVQSGRGVTEALIEAMGGEGGIVGLGGIANNVPAIERRAGMMEAIEAADGVELLDFQIGDWASSKAFSITQAWLTQYGDEIDGIWAANDEMALGAIQALTAEGLNGQIPVVSIDGTDPALQAIVSGDLVATDEAPQGLWAGYGMSLAYQAATGEYVPSDQGNERREFYGKTRLITADNVEEVIAEREAAPPQDYSRIWEDAGGQIQY